MTGRDNVSVSRKRWRDKAGLVPAQSVTQLETGRARARSATTALILAPTRELAAQVAQSFKKYGVNHKLAAALLIGGVNGRSVKKLDRSIDA